jgi:GDP-L-fucose synthase
MREYQMFENKNVLVTGGSGMIGRELVTLLQARGARVRVADIKDPDGMNDIEFVRADLRDFSDCKKIVKGMDYVFNLVGIKCSPKVCLERPADIMGPMMQFNTNMLEAAMKEGVDWYLYTSTVGVYQPAEVLVEDDVWQTQPSKNDWFGGWAKRMGELQCQAYERQYGEGRCSIVRPANVYGAYDNFDLESAMVVPSLIRKAFSGNKLSVWGDGSAIRDFIHARDVAEGMIFAVENKITQPMNLGSGEGVTIKKVTEIVAEIAGVEVEWDTTKPSGDARRVFDMTRANSFGFFPKVSIEDGIRETVSWYLENKNFADAGLDSFKSMKK